MASPSSQRGPSSPRSRITRGSGGPRGGCSRRLRNGNDPSILFQLDELARQWCVGEVFHLEEVEAGGRVLAIAAEADDVAVLEPVPGPEGLRPIHQGPVLRAVTDEHGLMTALRIRQAEAAQGKLALHLRHELKVEDQVAAFVTTQHAAVRQSGAAQEELLWQARSFRLRGSTQLHNGADAGSPRLVVGVLPRIAACGREGELPLRCGRRRLRTGGRRLRTGGRHRPVRPARHGATPSRAQARA
mmetsp:Transcript_11467/g.25461  ORF Transcript_11467/g.25461 Transcript_11467/m.25461 type:complete len:244 (+) Transcript_11467:422-1153(+)